MRERFRASDVSIPRIRVFSSQLPEGRGHFSGPKEQPDPRKELVLWWKNAPEKVIKYEKGSEPYEYPAGARLMIGDEGEEKQVMDTCETPWAFATVDMAFAELPSGPVEVFERGFGMGLTARRVIQNLITRGGKYTVVELNKGNADYARKWIERQKSALLSMASGLPGTKPDIAISLIEGEAYEETAKLAQEGGKFDIIISDTFPLSKAEQGINDLQDLATLKRCLNPGGIFTFFAYFPNSTGGMMRNQRDIINAHFGSYTVTEVPVNPPPSYEYLQTKDGPVRTLPIVICRNPKI